MKDECEQKGVKEAVDISKDGSSIGTEKRYIKQAQTQKVVHGKVMGKCGNSLLIISLPRNTVITESNEKVRGVRGENAKQQPQTVGKY